MRVDRATVSAHDLPGDEQAQTETSRWGGLLGLTEAFEQALEALLGDAGSSILDVDPCRSVLLRGSDDDYTPLRGVGERIRDEIEEDLLDPCPVSQDR